MVLTLVLAMVRAVAHGPDVFDFLLVKPSSGYLDIVELPSTVVFRQVKLRHSQDLAVKTLVLIVIAHDIPRFAPPEGGAVYD